MTPAEAIAMLDAELAVSGETVKLRKGSKAEGQVSVTAFVRGATGDQIAGTISQANKRVTLSPTGLDTFGMPSEGGFVVIGGEPKATIGKPEIIRIQNVVVRINMVVKG